MGRNVTFARPDGKEAAGYFAAPASAAAAPGVVVIQEWWGVNAQIEGVAAALAAAGYRALAPDLYRGKVTLDDAEADHLMNGLDFMDAAKQDIGGAVQFLARTNPAVGVVGFCMGGALTILSAVHVSEVRAVVDWYGVPPAAAVDARAIRAPVQGHFALLDSFFPIAQVDALEAAFAAASVEHEFYRYAARHAFGNENGPHYDPALKELAWSRTLAFFGKHLATAPER